MNYENNNSIKEICKKNKRYSKLNKMKLLIIIE